MILVPAVKALIVNDNKFLVVHDQGTTPEGTRYTYWDLPGGKPDYDEDPYETIKREVKEETDLDVELKEIVGMFWFMQADKKERCCTVFRCIPKGTDVSIDKNPSDEEKFIEYRWVTKEEFLKDEYHVLHHSLKRLIKDTDI